MKNNSSTVISIFFLLMSMSLMLAPSTEIIDVSSGENSQSTIKIWETFSDENLCVNNAENVPRNEGDILLNWVHGNGSSLAGQQRAAALDASPCSSWLNGGGLENTSDVNVLAELSLNVLIVGLDVAENNQAEENDDFNSGLLLQATILPHENLSDTLNLRWYITVDNSPLGESTASDVVLHYGWSTTFHHDAGNSTNWTQQISAERLAEDGIPFTADDIWRLEVTLMLVDDLNNSINAADTIQLNSPKLTPAFGGMVPTLLVVVGVIVGLLVMVRQDYRREVGLPRLRGTMRKDNKGWTADVEITAGIFDVTLKGALASSPWKISRAPSQQLVTAGTNRSFSVKLKTSDEESYEAVTHWEIDVDELGGWVLDLKLSIPHNK
ncbi:MAG: hypothetical protein HOE69_01210 [Euryarchaeota archaeon]|jgi:hypothetical protein|nr:hypothetical protein [Euryarchaeota archaeon]